MPWCVTLRRWTGGPIASLQWGPDGTTLAVAHSGKKPFVRLWNTQTWEICMTISLGNLAPIPRPSIAWCSNETLIGAAGGQFFEVCGVGTSGGGWASGFEPTSRTLPVPQLRSPDGPLGAEGAQQGVVEVAVCPRTHQRIAALVDGAPHVLVFERQGTEGWVRQELVLLGSVGAKTSGATDAMDEEGPGMDGGRGDVPRPRSIAFAGNAVHQQRGDASYEGSLLAVYWEFGHGVAEVRTYPMHFLPYRLMHSDASVIFD